MGTVLWGDSKLKYSDIIYPAITKLIESLLVKIDEYIDTAVIDDTEYLEDAHDLLNTHLEKVTNTYINAAPPCLTSIYHDLEKDQCFVNFPIDRLNQLKIILQLSSFVENDSGLDLDDDIGFDEDNFSFLQLDDHTIPRFIYGYHNSHSIDDSLLFIDFSSKYSSSDFSESSLSNGLISLLILKISKADLEGRLDFSKSYILCSKNTSNTVAISALKMNAALQGHVIHTEISMQKQSASPTQLSRISARHPYSQFEETLIILSEFNSTSDLLRKYLSIYHIIENFMFKIPLVLLGRENNGNVFSLRDFRRLNEAIQDRELLALTSIFKEQKKGAFWNRSISGGSFSNLVKTAAHNSTQVFEWDNTDCDIFLTKLQINTGGRPSITFLTNIEVKEYCELLYKIRCAIVHNKETELHLSYFKINKTIAILIENILIKPLHKLISDLLTDNSSTVWYLGPELKLYQT
ncbi:hypothetical protein [Aeromonas veronii]|uniref:hypothetical protein n=1 Tax=Aeromonas veronii TaxID=654 RepID=UPI0022461394|nr:hypothetical protein [Aeromonas veronii]MCX0440644.1 hypothetical protein [Aeromonas veronii]